MLKLKNIKTVLTVLAGNCILAFALSAFVLPYGTIVGGSTGISLIVNHYFGVDLSLVVGAINVIMFVVGFYFLGKKFALTTVVSSVVFPVLLSFFQSLESLQHMTDNELLAALYGGVLIGIGIGLVMRAGASTGGMDIPPLVLQKKCRIPVGVSMYVLDFSILIIQMFFSNTEQVLYGIVLTLLESVLINQVMVSGNQQIQVFAVSRRTESIRSKLVYELDLGVSMIHMESGYMGREILGLLCITSQRNLPAVKNAIREVDSQAFITVSRIYEVEGRGFTMNR